MYKNKISSRLIFSIFVWQFCLLEIADVGFPVEFGGQNPCSNWYAKVCPPWPGILWPVDQLGGPLGWCWRFAAKGSFRRREELKGYQNWGYSTLTLLAIILGCLTINEEGNEFAFAWSDTITGLAEVVTLVRILGICDDQISIRG